MDLLAVQNQEKINSNEHLDLRATLTSEALERFQATDYLKACSDFKLISENLLGPKGLSRLHQALAREGIHGAGGIVEMYFGDLIEARAAMGAELNTLAEKKKSLALEIANEALELREQLASKFQEVISQREKAIEENVELLTEQAKDKENHLNKIAALKAEIRDLELRRHEIRSEYGMELDTEAVKTREGKEINDGFSAVLQGLRTLCGWNLTNFPKDVPHYIYATLVPALLEYESKYGESSRAALVGEILNTASIICEEETAIALSPKADGNCCIFPSNFSNWLALISSPHSSLALWCERITTFAPTVIEKISLLIKELPCTAHSDWRQANEKRDRKMREVIGCTSVQQYLKNVPDLKPETN